jgi:uncharacterized protein
MSTNSKPAVPSQPKRRLSRRFWIRAAASCIAAGTGLAGWTVLFEPHWLSISQLELRLPNLPSRWRGRRLVHISDLHVGRVSIGYLKSAMQVVNSLQPDLLAITGDFLDRSSGLGVELGSVLSELEPAKIATVACLGNHDYGYGWSQVNVADTVVDTVSQHGIQLLRDERIELDGLSIMGIDDYWSPRFDPNQRLLRSSDPQVASLCLCHNPDVCDRHDWSSFQGAVLAGHTHGGQCKPPFLPPPILPVSNLRYTSGFFDLNPGRQMFITRGLGHTTQVRFNCRPEIAVFNLLPA